MTGIGKHDHEVCKDSASAMKTKSQAMMQPRQDGGQRDISFIPINTSK